jgi:hypothetical protein
MRKLLALSALAVIAPLSASAAPLKAGWYDLAGLQEICLKPNRTWYGVTYAMWGGGWSSGKAGTALYGTFTNFGLDGNDSVVLGPDDSGIWQEWTDDYATTVLIRNATLTLIGPDCPPPAAEGVGRGMLPTSR